MIFPTLNFLLFFAVVFGASWALCGWQTARKVFLVGASFFFYMNWNWKFGFLLAACIVYNWGFGHLIVAAPTPALRKFYVTVAVALNLLTLGFFKYYGFFMESLDELLRGIGMARDLPFLDIVLPVGISFFIFQGISYVVDVYRGELKRAHSLLDVAVFKSFFPQLVAGPIVRAADFMPQLQRPVDPRRIYAGMAFLLILWGLFKKAIVANYMSTEIVDKAFLDPGAYGAGDLLLATYAYAVQIYCDFSAYSDIAIGVAALLGYHFARNFDQPYRAQSLQDFWRRWHISLSTWLRDYLYIPLGGNRKGPVRTYANLLITMLLGGLWHGAALKFVFWGFLHGGGLAVERALGVAPRKRTAWGRVVAIVFIFHFVCLCWIFFRAESFARAIEFLSGFARWRQAMQLATPFLLVLLAWGIAMHFTPPSLLRRLEGFWSRRNLLWQGLAAGIVVVLIEAAGSEGVAPFIYFQF